MASLLELVVASLLALLSSCAATNSNPCGTMTLARFGSDDLLPEAMEPGEAWQSIAVLAHCLQEVSASLSWYQPLGQPVHDVDLERLEKKPGRHFMQNELDFSG